MLFVGRLCKLNVNIDVWVFTSSSSLSEKKNGSQTFGRVLQKVSLLVDSETS